MSGRIFGHMPGYPVGSRFETRAELSEAGVHQPRVAGISGGAWEGADSVVLSGGYEDDADFWDEIVYVGHGRRDRETGRTSRRISSTSARTTTPSPTATASASPRTCP